MNQYSLVDKHDDIRDISGEWSINTEYNNNSTYKEE